MAGLILQCLPCIFDRHARKLKTSIDQMGNKIFLNLKDIKEKLSFLVNAVKLIREIQKAGSSIVLCQSMSLGGKKALCQGGIPSLRGESAGKP